MKKTCFAVSLILHLLFVYWFTTLNFTHKSPVKEREKKEIIVVTPVRLYMPLGKDIPVKKELVVIDPAAEPLPVGRENTGAGLAVGSSKETEQAGKIGEKVGQERKIAKIITSMPDSSLNPGIDFKPGTIDPSAEPRFSLSPGKIRNIIGKNDNGRSRTGGPPGIALRGTGTLGGRSSPAVRGCNIMPWARRVISRIKKNWSIPLISEIGTKGVAGVSIIVERDGKILSASLTKTSGSETLDKAALAAFTHSNPLPGLPDDYPYHDLRAYFLFNYNDRKIEQPVNEGEEK